MSALRANVKVIVVVLLVLAVGGWLILMSQAAGDVRSAASGQPGTDNIPRLGQSTPKPSDGPTSRWAATPMPAPGRNPPNLPAQGPAVIPSAGSVVIGTEMSIRGQDFQPLGEVTIELDRSGGTALLIAEGIPINRDGGFAFPFQPGAEFPPGDYTIVARSESKEARAQVRLVGGKPVAVVDPSAAKPGQELGVTGGGFASGETVGLHLDTLASPPFHSVRADDHGDVSGAFTVPMAAEGEHLLILVGERSRTLVPARFTAIGFYPWVDLSSYASQPEIYVDFQGHNFAPSEDIWVFVDEVGLAPIARTRTDREGEFAIANAYYVAPNLRGDHRFFFLGSTSQKVAEATFSALSYSPALELSAYAGKPGSKFSLTGEGFARGETLRAYWGAPEEGVLLSESTAGPDGSFRGWGDLSVPLGADIMKGGANITVVGELSQAPVGSWFTLVALTPSAELNKYSGPPGEVLQFSGNGFAPTERVVISLAGESDVLWVAQAGDDGSFANAGSFTVPTGRTEVLEFIFTGALSNSEARTHYRLELPGEGQAS